MPVAPGMPGRMPRLAPTGGIRPKRFSYVRCYSTISGNSMIVPEPLTSEDLLKLYYYLKLNRCLEDRLAALYRQSIITATVFTSRGQEAISVGSAYALTPDDLVSPLTRNIGTMLVRGIRPRDIFTQYMGKATSPTGGKERIHYFGDLSKGIVASLSILGDMVPVMAGMALAARIQGRSSVALTYLGGRDQHRRFSRRYESGGRVAPSLRAHHRKQSLCVFHSGVPRRRRRRFRFASPVLRYSRQNCRRQ